MYMSHHEPAVLFKVRARISIGIHNSLPSQCVPFTFRLLLSWPARHCTPHATFCLVHGNDVSIAADKDYTKRKNMLPRFVCPKGSLVYVSCRPGHPLHKLFRLRPPKNFNCQTSRTDRCFLRTRDNIDVNSVDGDWCDMQLKHSFPWMTMRRY